jgi:hypothetical protein
MEHIKRAETQGAVLEWANLLKMGGILEIHTSNVIGVARMMEAHKNHHDHARFSIYMFGKPSARWRLSSYRLYRIDAEDAGPVSGI